MAGSGGPVHWRAEAGAGAAWRAAGALGRMWRLHKGALPPEAVEALAKALLATRACLMPWLAPDRTEGEQLLEVLAALAGAPAGGGRSARLVPQVDKQVQRCAPQAFDYVDYDLNDFVFEVEVDDLDCGAPAPSTPRPRGPAADAGTPPRAQRACSWDFLAPAFVPQEYRESLGSGASADEVAVEGALWKSGTIAAPDSVDSEPPCEDGGLRLDYVARPRSLSWPCLGDVELLTETVCPGAHPMVFERTEGEFLCDRCDADIPARQALAICVPCDLSVCQRCIVRGIPFAEEMVESDLEEDGWSEGFSGCTGYGYLHRRVGSLEKLARLAAWGLPPRRLRRRAGSSGCVLEPASSTGLLEGAPTTWRDGQSVWCKVDVY